MGNTNRFATREECHQQCIAPKLLGNDPFVVLNFYGFQYEFMSLQINARSLKMLVVVKVPSGVGVTIRRA